MITPEYRSEDFLAEVTPSNVHKEVEIAGITQVNLVLNWHEELKRLVPVE